MSDKYRIFGAEFSPYSVKVRSYFRFKQIPHEWLVRNPSNFAEFQKHAKLPLIPLVIPPEGDGFQDSTPIIEKLEAQFPEPSIHTGDPTLDFLSALIEEYADEWGNKQMFHYRWAYEADQKAASLAIATSQMAGAAEEDIAKMADKIRERMIPRRSFVGSSDATAQQIESSLQRTLSILDSHFADRKYLLGDRPAFGDFGLYAQLYECTLDPTASAILKRTGPNLLPWIERMLQPKVEGDFDGWVALEPTLAPLLEKEIGGLFLPWSTANAKALEAGESEFTASLEGRPFTQGTQKYHARSLAKLRARYAEVADKSGLEGILEGAGCLKWL